MYVSSPSSVPTNHFGKIFPWQTQGAIFARAANGTNNAKDFDLRGDKPRKTTVLTIVTHRLPILYTDPYEAVHTPFKETYRCMVQSRVRKNQL